MTEIPDDIASMAASLDRLAFADWHLRRLIHLSESAGSRDLQGRARIHSAMAAARKELDLARAEQDQAPVAGSDDVLEEQLIQHILAFASPRLARFVGRLDEALAARQETTQW